MSVAIEEGPDERALVATHLRLAFRWTGDRWAHTLEIGPPAARRLFAASIEADAERDDPARVVSPTYQDLHLQHDGDAVLALLVGKFAGHHFSASFRVEERPRDGAIHGFVAVDLADRCRSTCEALAATYLLCTSPSTLEGSDEHGAKWSPDATDVTVSLASPEHEGHPASLAVAEMGRAGMQAQIGARLRAGEQTHRLKYLWTSIGNASRLS